MTYLLGLTGSIGMGKSTTAQMFRDEGIAVWDADAVVHALYAKGGAGVSALEVDFPTAIVDGAVSRFVLRGILSSDPSKMDTLNSIIHPLVAADRAAFIAANNGFAVLDIPLLFESGTDAICDAVLVVSAPAENQRQRVLSRNEMSVEQFEMILSRQMPDAEKRQKADHVIQTLTLDATRLAVRHLIAEIKGQMADA